MKSIIEREASKAMHLNFTIKSSFFNEIYYWTWGDFRKQFRHEGQSNTEQIITSICKVNTMKQDMLNSQINLTSQAPTGVPIRLTRCYN